MKSDGRGTRRIARAFASLRDRGEAGFVPFLTFGESARQKIGRTNAAQLFSLK